MKILVSFFVLFAAFCLSSAAQSELLDLHYHWEGKADLDQMIKKSTADGVRLGVTAEGGAQWGVKNDALLLEFLGKLEGKRVFKGLQVYSRGWTAQYSKQTLAKLDYIAADALLFPNSDGKMIALWGEKVNFSDPQDFMERYIAFHLEILKEPIDIWSNPTFLPTSLEQRYAELWTRERMLKLIRAAVANNLAIELNSKYNIPSPDFIRLAKQEGAKFTYGTNRHDDEPGDLAFCLKVSKECGLSAADFFVPKGARAGR